MKNLNDNFYKVKKKERHKNKKYFKY